jgi:hypothetical protein
MNNNNLVDIYATNTNSRNINKINSPHFIGSRRDFDRFIGPKLRNIVQQITKNHKAKIGSCEHCGKTGVLEAAHIRGRERSVMVDDILKNHLNEDKFLINLTDFEVKFREMHSNLNEIILILCKDCHTSYDYNNLTHVNKNMPDYKSNDINNSQNIRIYTNTEIQIKLSNKAQTMPQLELDKLCTSDYSKITLNNNYPLFVKVPENASIENRRKAITDLNGYNRWTWRHEFIRNGYSYAISTQWYPYNDEYVKAYLNLAF